MNNLTPSQSAMCAAKLATMKHGSNQHAKKGEETQNCASIDDAAKLFSVSPRSVDTAKEVISKGSKQLQTACESGKVKVSLASQLAKKCEDKSAQDKLLKQGTAAIRTAALHSTPPWIAPGSPEFGATSFACRCYQFPLAGSTRVAPKVVF